jgi:hypothetical protein
MAASRPCQSLVAIVEEAEWRPELVWPVWGREQSLDPGENVIPKPRSPSISLDAISTEVSPVPIYYKLFEMRQMDIDGTLLSQGSGQGPAAGSSEDR